LINRVGQYILNNTEIVTFLEDRPSRRFGCLLREHPLITLELLTTASYGSNDASLRILLDLCTPASILFDPRFTSVQKPSAVPPFRTFPPSPTVDKKRTPVQIPSIISIRDLDPTPSFDRMDKRHPSSFAQLEKLGEGTYATVSHSALCDLWCASSSGYFS
jgi:hypothetical protein